MNVTNRKEVFNGWFGYKSALAGCVGGGCKVSLEICEKNEKKLKFLFSKVILINF